MKDAKGDTTKKVGAPPLTKTKNSSKAKAANTMSKAPKSSGRSMKSYGC